MLPPDSPQNIYRNCRAWVFACLKKTKNIGLAAKLINDLSIDEREKAGLLGELYYCSKFPNATPALDIGDKTDFVKGKLCVDVTTNPLYKNLKDYEELSKNKKYALAWVDLKTRQVEEFPIRFLYCPECGNTTYFVVQFVYDNPWWDCLSTSQIVFQYCPYCSDEVGTSAGAPPMWSSYHISSAIRHWEQERRDYLSEMTPRDAKKEESARKAEINADYLHTSKFFQKLTGANISAVIEEEYVTTDKDGGGFWTAKAVWKHPIYGQELDDEIFYSFE